MGLRDHPFPVRAHFASSLVVTFAVPVAEARQLLPACLEPDTWGEGNAFLAAALVDTLHLRPAALPAFMGQSFFLLGYRIFVRYTNSAGKRLRGLYILRSETNRRRMQWLCNIFTHYGYTTTDIHRFRRGQRLTIKSARSDFYTSVIIDDGAPPPLPEGSCFDSWKEARRFAGPLPFTFTYKPATREVIIVEGVRQHWSPRPVRLVEQHVGFVEGLGFSSAPAVSAFMVTDIPYYWRAGKTEVWQP